tara:strand:- start:273 stop:1187 length:915 start_codon:yes stop_codon:yes gene_type:complete
MEENIIIFGKNSIIANNFSKKVNLIQSNVINISRFSNNTNALNCNIGEFIYPKDINSIVNKIKEKLIYRKTVFILFSWNGVPRTVDKTEEIWSSNMYIIQNFMSIAEIINPSRIIFLSSAGALYPENKKSYKFSEKDITFPTTSYGRQKLLSEKLLSNFAKIHNQEITILRISSGYGFDKRFSDQGAINKWLYLAINEKKLELYNSKDSQINFISFDQISNAIILCIKNKLSGIYNIGTESSISLGEVIEEIKNITNKKIVIEEINYSKRYLNIDSKKFTSKTGIKFELNLKKNIKLIYESIIQ